MFESLPPPVYFWIKALHITAMVLWFAGLFFLPRLLLARRRGERDGKRPHFDQVANAVYFRVLTPAGAATIALGALLVAGGPHGAWLVMKMVLVAIAVLIHLYLGVVLHEFAEGRPRHRPMVFHALGWAPLLLLLAAAGLTGAKPMTAAGQPPPPSSVAAEPT